MTCIVAIKDGDDILIGADSAGIAGFCTSIRKDRKVFKRGEFVIGFTGSYRMGQILQYADGWPVLEENVSDEELHKWMCTVLMDWTREIFHEKGYLQKKDERESGGFFLIGVRGHIYEINSDFQVAENVPDYASVGCGDEFALGSFYATNAQKSAKNRAIKALEGAAYFSAGVCGPFVFVSTGDE